MLRRRRRRRRSGDRSSTEPRRNLIINSNVRGSGDLSYQSNSAG
jgi:hypothetical protein